jgi:hypothetical protein
MFKSSARSDAVNPGLPDLFHQSCEISLRFREAI